MTLGGMIIPAVSTTETPLNILGTSCTHWVNPDSRVMGTPPDISTLTNLAPNGANPTQAISTRRPHLTTLNGRNYSDHVGGGLQGLVGANASPTLYPANATAVALWCIIRIANFNDQWATMEVGATASNTGMNIRVVSPDKLQLGVSLSTGTWLVQGTGFVINTVYRILAKWDGTDATLWSDNVLKGTVTPTGGSVITAAATNLAYGAAISAVAPSSFWSGLMRGTAVMNGVPTVAQQLAMNTYQKQSGGV